MPFGTILTSAANATPIAAASGPFAPLVFVGSLAANFLFPSFGAGRTEADHLTEPGTGAQWFLEQYHQKLTDEYNALKASGGLTISIAEEYRAAYEKALSEFVTYAQQFPRAGPGAIRSVTEATVAHINTINMDITRLQKEGGTRMAVLIVGGIGIGLLYFFRSSTKV